MASTFQSSQPRTDALELARISGDEDRIVAELRKTKSSEGNRAEQVAGILRQTSSPRVRNAAAIALADMRIPTAAQVLIEILDKPENRKQSGTLLYALEEIKAKVPLRTLVNIILEGSFEARQEAIDLIESRLVKSTETEIHQSVDGLKRATPSDKEQAASISRALKAISSLHRPKACKHSARASRLSYQRDLVSIVSKAKGFRKNIVSLKKGEAVRVKGLGVLVAKPRLAKVKKGASKRVSARRRTVAFKPSISLNEKIEDIQQMKVKSVRGGTSKVPKDLKRVMANNSAVLEELTKKLRDSDSPRPKQG
jgi:nucleoid DNA-binding protein